MNTAVAFKSLQEILDQTVDYLCSQDRSALLPNGSCAYRTPDGNCCAVGFWIPPELYRPLWDRLRHGAVPPADFWLHHQTEGAPFAAALAAGGIDVKAPHVIDLLMLLQRAHDSSSTLFFHDKDGRPRTFRTRTLFFDAFIPHRLELQPIPGVCYTPRGPSGR